MNAPRPRRLDAHGLGLRLWEHGGEGPCVLFVHGYLDTGRSFDAIASLLEGHARCLCLDLRGHGQSDRVGAGGSYHLLDHLKDVSAVVHLLESEGTKLELLVGHSMGGNVSLMLAGALPDLVRRMLLIDALGPPAEPPEEQPDRLGRVLEARQRVRPFGSFDSVDDAVERLRALNPGLSVAGARRMAEPALVDDEEVAGKLRFPFDARLKGPTPVRHPEEMWRSLCARIRAPVHVLRAENGYVPEGEPATTRIAAMADGRMTTVTGAPHHMHVENPEVIADAVREMLDVELD